MNVGTGTVTRSANWPGAGGFANAEHRSASAIGAAANHRAVGRSATRLAADGLRSADFCAFDEARNCDCIVAGRDAGSFGTDLNETRPAVLVDSNGGRSSRNATDDDVI